MPSIRSKAAAGEQVDSAIFDTDDWNFCQEHLEAVSRTFSQPISMLEGELRVATTCGYLLCRIADSIEDHPGLNHEERQRLLRRFSAVLEDGESASSFTTLADEHALDSPEWTLACKLPRVLSVFEDGLGDASRETCVHWIGEMVRGMELYGRRRPDGRGIIVLKSVSDLERYCYFVAGTVGRMLTGLFVASRPDLSDVRLDRLETHAVSFGLGLQLVNILKDQTDDLSRGWSFVPESVWRRVDAHPAALDGTDHAELHAALEPIFERASDHLDAALEYTLALPEDARPIRLFCLLPLWMAVRTLVCAHGNDAMFTDEEPVKIERSEVHELIDDCVENAGDDDYLRKRYAELWDGYDALD